MLLEVRYGGYHDRRSVATRIDQFHTKYSGGQPYCERAAVEVVAATDPLETFAADILGPSDATAA